MQAFVEDSIRKEAWPVVEAMIDFEKPVIVGVNGPSFGFATTTSQLADIVYCAESTFFEVSHGWLAGLAGCNQINQVTDSAWGP